MKELFGAWGGGERTSVNQGVVEIFMSCSMYLNIPLTTGALDSFSEI